MSVILKNVNKIYESPKEKVHAVIDLNMEIRDGELLALLGPSGCGKSSTLRMIAGLEEVSDGTIYFGDRIVNGLSPMERNIAMAFESYSLYPHMTVHQNIGFPLDVMNVPKEEKDKKVREIAGVFHLEEFLEKRPPQLSGGQQQRVSLARALVRDPHVYWMSRFPIPTPISRFQMRAEIKKLHYKLSATMVYVTHDQIDALSMADRIAVMNFAKLQQIGTRSELYDTPVNKFVAGFVGEPHINFLECEVVTDGGKVSLHVVGSDNLNLEITEAKGQKIKEKKKVWVGVRPQNVITEKKPGSIKINGKVDFSEFVGEKVITTVGNGDSEFRLLTPTTKRFKDDEAVEGYIPNEYFLLFNFETEEAIY